LTVPVAAAANGRTTIRHDSRWQVADTLLPFDPRALEAVA
jgi:hypothetical protein